MIAPIVGAFLLTNVILVAKPTMVLMESLEAMFSL